jgi:hypothetical protein
VTASRIVTPRRTSPLGGRLSRRGLLVAALCLGFLAVSGGAAWLLDTASSDLDGFFWPSAEIAAHGHPLLVYTVRAGAYPDANGPLGLLPLSLVAAVANGLGVASTMRVRDALAQAIFAVFVLLMAWEAARCVGLGRGRPAHPIRTCVLFLALPPLWVATIGFGHVEEPLELWLLLVGVRLAGRGATLRAGACIGLAVLTRSMAAVALIPLVLGLLADRRARGAVALLATSCVVVAAGLVPFWLADRADLVFSLLTFRAALPVAGGSLWFAFRQAPWIGWVQADDSWLFGGAALVLSAAFLAARRHPAGGALSPPPARPGLPDPSARRPEGPPRPRQAELRSSRRPPQAAPRPEEAALPSSLRPPGVFGLLAIATLCTPMLAKTAWPYYLLDPCVFATIWWLGRPTGWRSWRAIPPLTLAALGGVLGGLEQSLPLAALPGSLIGALASATEAVVIGMILLDGVRMPGRAADGHRPAVGAAASTGTTPVPGIESPGC